MAGRAQRDRPVLPDPLNIFSRVGTKSYTFWLRTTYPFAGFGRGISIHPSCDVYRNSSRYIDLGDETYIARDVWLSIVGQSHDTDAPRAKIVLGKRCKIGRRSVISSKNLILLEDDVLLGPSVLIMDHNHEYSDPSIPIHAQGVSEGGRIVIGRNCWLGYGSVISCARGELVVGQNSVIGANSVVTKSFPPFSVIAGNPAKLLKSYDPQSDRWLRATEGSEEAHKPIHVDKL